MQSWNSGGTDEILPMERSRATFDVEKMTYILDGGESETRKRRWIQNSHDDAFDDDGDDRKKTVVRDDSDRSRSDLVAEAMRHFMDVHWKHLKRGYKPSGQDMTFMSAAKFGLTGPLSLHYGVFMSTLRSQTSKEQREWWLDAGYKLNFIGCYAQTELGWGSNVRALKTTATFVRGAGKDGEGEFELHTPTLRSMKWWSTGLFSATHAALYAQLIVDGESKGVHVFFVQLRGPDLKPLPGVEMGDIGRKLGDNDTPIGYLRLNRVRIPRRHLMEAKAHVTREGRYVLGPPPSSSSSVVTKKKKNKTTKKNKNVSHYITMLKTRIGLTNTAGAALAKAATIAVRYSAVRHQGFKATSTSRRYEDPENSILDYENQLFRCLQWTSSAYGIKFVARWLLKKRKKMERDHQDQDLQEVHACAAGLKALCCCLAADGIEDLRRACGGHGYLLSSGIAALEADFKGPNTTAEGDYVVLALQTARFLIKSVKKRGDRLVGTTSILEPLRLNQAFARPSSPSSLVSLLCSTTEASMKQTRSYLASLFAYRSLVRVVLAEREHRYLSLIFLSLSLPSHTHTHTLILVRYIFHISGTMSCDDENL